MVNKLIKKIFFGKKAFQSLFRRLFDISMEGMNIGTGGRNSDENGELFTLKYILNQEQKPIIFDVGAQGKDYIQSILDISQNQAKIYAFEPSSKDYDSLKKVFEGKITLIKSALGHKEGKETLYYSNNTSGLSSLYKPYYGVSGTETVEIQTIDNFCKSKNIESITFLKLDVEGSELACLRGAIQMLPSIKYIQFEFGAASRESKTYFRDIFDFLSDYRIYRILKDGFYEIKDSEKITELLFTTNYFAERKSI